MSVYSMYFSPTGGTERVMNILTEGLPVSGRIDLSEPGADYGAYSFTEEDLCLIGAPSFGGRVPSVVLERVRKTRANGAAAVLVVAFGNRAYDDTLLELKNEVNACGYRAAAAVAAVTEHSIMRQYGKERPDERDEMELRRFSKEIAKLTRDGKNIKDFKEFTAPRNFPYKKYNGVPFKPKAGVACTKCGLCAEKCPVQAIPQNDPAALEKDKCISCMRCIAICPRNARKLNRAVLFAASQAMKKAFAERKQNELYL